MKVTKTDRPYPSKVCMCQNSRIARQIAQVALKGARRQSRPLRSVVASFVSEMREALMSSLRDELREKEHQNGSITRGGGIDHKDQRGEERKMGAGGK